MQENYDKLELRKNVMTMKKRPFIIDCDTGTDDTIALVAALGCEEMEIVGITSVNGNVAEVHTSRNNLDLMDYLCCEIPVTRGAYMPLLTGYSTAAGDNVHGKRGLGTVELPESQRQFDDRIAAQFIYEEALKRNGELELLVTGPMTNIAIAIIEHPDLRDYIRHLYFMGGATIGGNVNTTAEYNIWVDPEACHTVLMSGIPCTMVGLNVSDLAIMNEKEEQLLRSYGTRESILVADILVYMMNRWGINVARMHDPLALASAIYPECLEFKELFADAECNGKYTRGHTAVDLKDRKGLEHNARVAVDIDVERFTKWLCERIRTAGEKGKERRGE